jgi:beta-N-acetylhexosaminidase
MRKPGLIRVFSVFMLVFLAFSGVNRNEYLPKSKALRKSWADSVFAGLSTDQKIGQLFMVAAYSNKDAKHANEIENLIKKHHIGGLIFFQGGPVRQAALTNRFQGKSKIPLLISIDGEWGLAMRLDSTISYPRQMTLGALADDSLIYEMGREIGRQCRRMGIHVNLAPVADVNNNPSNPVIMMRSFGENKNLVARKAVAYMKGMQSVGVMANGKHFPGHGDTDADSHKTLPVIKHSRKRLDSLELFPFRELVKEGIGSMMVAHLYVPALDTTTNTATTLSPKVVNDLLKKEMKFQGLIFTDALNMKGVSGFYQPGEVDVKALLAGNDVLLFSQDVPKAIDEIKSAVATGKISQAEIDERVLKILKAKEWCGLNKYKPIELQGLVADLNSSRSEFLRRKLFGKSITALKNERNILPLKRLDTLRIAVVNLGTPKTNGFGEIAGNYSAVKVFTVSKQAKAQEVDSMMAGVKWANLVLVNICQTSPNATGSFGFSTQQGGLLKKIAGLRPVVLSVFGNPYLAGKIDDIDKSKAVLFCFEENEHSLELLPQVIFGGRSATGRLPVTASAVYPAGSGVDIFSNGRFAFTWPEEFGIARSQFRKIDSLVNYGISEKAFPGAQLLIAKSGKVIYKKSYGYHTYAQKRPVSDNDIYDLASITKIAASTAALMDQVEKGRIKLDDHLCYHLPELEGTNKMNLTIREILSHQAGLKDWIPFWMKTVKKGEYKSGLYTRKPDATHTLRVSDSLYMLTSYKDSIWKAILESEVKKEGEYKYSDLGYYMIQKIIEKYEGESLDTYLEKRFYRPLGMTTATYKPREKFPLSRIVPTEYDALFRKQLVWGDVHDQGAAMMGGVGGHAGLFSNATDLATMMQLFMNFGVYGEEKYLDSTTVAEFIRCQFCPMNRRGAGFDKPETDPMRNNPVCSCASPFSFGHSGFTGTFAWADPATGIVYILLTNRVYPDANVNKLVKLGLRSKIQEEVYLLVGTPAERPRKRKPAVQK